MRKSPGRRRLSGSVLRDSDDPAGLLVQVPATIQTKIDGAACCRIRGAFMIEFGLRAHDLGMFDARSLASAIRDAGFDGIQLAPPKVIRNWPASPSRDDARVLGESLRAQGVRVDVLGCYIDPAHPDPAVREASLLRFERELSLCSCYGARIIATETGRPSGSGSAESARQDFDLLVDSFSRLASRALDEGVSIAVEPVWEHCISSPELVVSLLDAVASPALKILLDPCNLVSPALCEAAMHLMHEGDEGRCHETAVPALKVLKMAGSRVVALHAKDFFYSNGIKQGTWCGQGFMDWESLAQAIMETLRDESGTGLRVPVVIEEQLPGGHKTSRDYLESMFQKTSRS